MKKLAYYKVTSFWKTKQGEWLKEASFLSDKDNYIPTESTRFVYKKLSKPVEIDYSIL